MTKLSPKNKKNNVVIGTIRKKKDPDVLRVLIFVISLRFFLCTEGKELS